MARAVGDFTLVNPGEDDLYTFDFSTILVAGDSILSATWEISVASGVDPAAAACAKGVATVFGTKVTQKAGGFLAGVVYIMTAKTRTQFGLSPLLWCELPGEAIGC